MEIPGVVWFGHSSFLLKDVAGKALFLDPYDLKKVPRIKADLVFITHLHSDHWSIEDLKKVITLKSTLITPHGGADKSGLSNPFVLVKPGETHAFGDLTVKTISAYNSKPDRLNYHLKSNGWVGYIFEFNGKRIYHAGDTDFVPEMNKLGELDLAFLPMGGTFTMDVLEAIAAANTIHAKVTVPIHYKALLKDKAKLAETQFRDGVKGEVAILKEYA